MKNLIELTEKELQNVNGGSSDMLLKNPLVSSSNPLDQGLSKDRLIHRDIGISGEDIFGQIP